MLDYVSGLIPSPNIFTVVHLSISLTQGYHFYIAILEVSFSSLHADASPLLSDLEIDPIRPIRYQIDTPQKQYHIVRSFIECLVWILLFYCLPPILTTLKVYRSIL